jgi:NAD(P)H dehydrogenase (quinone)
MDDVGHALFVVMTATAAAFAIVAFAFAVAVAFEGDELAIDGARAAAGVGFVGVDVHGGGELGIREMLDHLMVTGALIYSGGASLGKPVIHLGPVGIDNTLDIDQFIPNFEIYGKRMAQKAVELFS